MFDAAWFNSWGIILEIIGFGLILYAVRPVKHKASGFSTGIDHLKTVVSNLHPWTYWIGTLLVIMVWADN